MKYLVFYSNKTETGIFSGTAEVELKFSIETREQVSMLEEFLQEKLKATGKIHITGMLPVLPPKKSKKNGYGYRIPKPIKT